MKNWTVIGINYDPTEQGNETKFSKPAKNKLEAWMLYDSFKCKFDEVVVLDEDGEYCDPCEL